jgi:hypothetical protein
MGRKMGRRAASGNAIAPPGAAVSGPIPGTNLRLKNNQLKNMRYYQRE